MGYRLPMIDELGNPIGNPLPIEASGTASMGSPGNDLIQGLNGKDILYGREGDDILEGGADSDILVGWPGNDRLYGDSQRDLAQAIATGRTETASGKHGDWLNGGIGDDILVTGADNDALFGGVGSDVLVGGAGDDFLNGQDDYTAKFDGYGAYDGRDFNWSITEAGNPFDPLVEPCRELHSRYVGLMNRNDRFAFSG